MRYGYMGAGFWKGLASIKSDRFCLHSLAPIGVEPKKSGFNSATVTGTLLVDILFGTNILPQIWLIVFIFFLFAIGRSVQAIVRGYVQEYQTSKEVRQ